MASLEEELKQTKFADEHIKANLNVLFTGNWLYNKISTHLRKFKVTHEQFNVLRILRGSHPKSMSQKDILTRMIAPTSNLTLIIKKLVSKELIAVVQCNEDKRQYEITITVSGMSLLELIDKDLESSKIRFNALTISEAFHLNALLDKLREE